MMKPIQRSLGVLLSMGVLLFASASVRAVDQSSTTGQLRFAFIYRNDADSANSFQELLEENKLKTDLIALDDLSTTNFDKYATVIIGSDIKQAWSESAANAIRDTEKPVLGLGEGGYYFFGKLGLAIGSPHGWHGGEVAVRAMRQDEPAFWSNFELNLPDDGVLVLYAASGQVGIYLPDSAPGVVPLGQELKSSSHYIILEQDRRNVMWGFTGSPEEMTALGKQMFVHTCRYLAKTDDDQVSGREQQPESFVSATPTPEIKQSPQPEARVLELESPAGVIGTAEATSTDKLRFGLIYLKDLDSANGFKELLEKNDLKADLIQLDDVPMCDFAPYAAVIVSPDIKKAWSTSAAHRVRDTKLPVLGIGEGGSFFFEKLNLAIGWMHAWQGGDVAVRAMSPTQSDFWLSSGLKLTEDEELVLYAETGHSGIYLPNPVAGVVPLGQELVSSTHYPIIEQARRYVLWGFGGSPEEMTALGKQLFVHTCGYVAKADGHQVSRQENQPESLVSETPHIVKRMQQLEERIARLESSATVDKNAVDQASTPNHVFSGNWVTLAEQNQSITRLSIYSSSEGQLSIRAWGACHPTDCDWGATPLYLLGDTVSSRKFPYGFATWNHGFTDVYFTLRVENDELIVESYDIFKDDSGRSNYRQVERFRRDTSPIAVPN